MDKTGRNDPCPCGSGKKFKRCCGASAATVDPEEEAIAASHALDHEVAEEVLRWTKKRFGEGWYEGAIDAYCHGVPLGDELEIQLLAPWSLFHYQTDGAPVAHLFLEERRTRLPEERRGWLEAQLRSWLSVWEVLEVEVGRGLLVRDLLTGEQRSVHEVAGSKALSVRDNVLGRVVDYRGVSTFCGMHPRLLSPSHADHVLREVRRLCHVRTKLLSVERLRDVGVQHHLIDAWHAGVLAVDLRPPPQLCNTDGEPLLLTSDHFDFAPDRRQDVVAALQEVEGAQEPEDLEDGGGTEVTVTKPGNAKVKAWDNTIIGRLVIRENRLTAETNSVRRADDLRRRLEASLGSLLRFRVREHSDPEALMKARRKDEVEREPEPVPEEALAILREFKEKHMASWVDESIPFLGGLTPRQAATKPATRAKLEVLLRDMENRDGRMPPDQRFDYDRIRRELGLAL